MSKFRICEILLSILLAFYGAYQVYAGDIRLGVAISIIAILMHIPNEDDIAEAVLRRSTLDVKVQIRKGECE